jgi:hypothetical protein
LSTLVSSTLESLAIIVSKLSELSDNELDKDKDKELELELELDVSDPGFTLDRFRVGILVFESSGLSCNLSVFLELFLDFLSSVALRQSELMFD